MRFRTQPLAKFGALRATNGRWMWPTVTNGILNTEFLLTHTAFLKKRNKSCKPSWRGANTSSCSKSWRLKDKHKDEPHLLGEGLTYAALGKAHEPCPRGSVSECRRPENRPVKSLVCGHQWNNWRESSVTGPAAVGSKVGRNTMYTNISVSSKETCPLWRCSFEWRDTGRPGDSDSIIWLLGDSQSPRWNNVSFLVWTQSNKVPLQVNWAYLLRALFSF